MSNTPKLRFKEFNDEWRKSLLKDKSDVLSGKRIPKGMSLTGNETDTPYVTVSDMGDITVDTTNLRYIEPEVEKHIYKYKVYENDIIISVAGTLGKINVIDKKLDGANLTENCDKITNLKELNFKYLFYFLNTNSINNQIRLSSTMCGQPKLALEKIRLFKIGYPSLPEQEKIASFLSLIDDKISLQSEKVEALKDYKKGIMQKIFSQELRFKDKNGEDYPEWEKKKLGELVNNKKVTLDRGSIIPKSELNGEFPVYSSSIKNNGLMGHNSKYMFEEPRITWSIDGGGHFFYRDTHKYSVTNVSGILNVLDCNISMKYLYYNLSFNHSKKTFDYQMKAHPSVISKIYIVSLPHIEEQEKIALLLSNIDKKIELEQEKLEQLQEYKKGLLQQMFV